MTAAYDKGMVEVDIEDALPSPLFLHPNERELRNERRQCELEGRELSSLEPTFDELVEADELSQQKFTAFLDAAAELPIREGYPYDEPSSLEAIHGARPEGADWPSRSVDDLNEPYDVVYGGWLGAIAGCFLGKPVEGWSRDKIHQYLEASDQFPLSGYVRSDVPEAVAREYDIYNSVLSSTADESMFVNDVPHMPVDDDIDYIVVGLGVLTEHGFDFEPIDVANYWLQNLTAFNTYTAERIAYKNFMNLVLPPESASHRNPYREHIGATIRADMWGYAALGDPEQAAAYAWRDASISHTKNGIYSEMWAATMIAAAAFETDPRRLLRIGLSQVPADGRLAAAVETVLEWRDAGLDYETAVSRVHERWDEANQFDWSHSISNAQLLAIGLLWGDGDFGSSLCLTAQAGFDTDSNGATLGSILGVAHGAAALPDEWVEPLDDTVETSLISYQRQRISDLARETVDLVQDAPN